MMAKFDIFALSHINEICVFKQKRQTLLINRCDLQGEKLENSGCQAKELSIHQKCLFYNVSDSFWRKILLRKIFKKNLLDKISRRLIKVRLAQDLLKHFSICFFASKWLQHL